MNLLKQFLENELHLDSTKYLDSFLLYEELLLEWNKKINLVSRKSDSIEDHILTSIFFLTKYNLNKVMTIVDIGTGGGFPGIPLKILFPDIEIILVDSIQKKINVLQDILSKLKLHKIEAVCGRAEIISKHIKFKAHFDVAISKSVSSLSNLYKWGSGYLKNKGEMLCIKGGEIENEMDSINNLKYNINIEVIKFDLNPVYKIHDKKLVIIKS